MNLSNLNTRNATMSPAKKGFSFDFTLKPEHIIWILSAVVALSIYVSDVRSDHLRIVTLEKSKVDLELYNRELEHHHELAGAIKELTISVNILKTKVEVLNTELKYKKGQQ